jgi:Mn2+/Fe2+ NRAMP family transporter
MMVTVIVNISIVGIFAELKDTHSSLDLITAGEAFDTLGATRWGLGLLAAGCSASLAVTLAGQHVLQGYWKLEISGWKRTLLTRSLAIAPSLLLPALIDLSKICNIHLDNKLNLIQSLNLPFVLIVLMRLCRSKKVIREFKASMYVIVLCTISTVLIVILNLWSVLISSNGVAIALFIFPGFVLYMLFMYKLYTVELNTIEKYRSLKSYLTFN